MRRKPKTNNYKELIDGLRCCSTGTDGCKNCPYSCGSAVCIHRLVSDALAEIEGKQAKIDRLTAENCAKEQYIAETIGKLARERKRDDEIIASLQKELVEAAKERDAAIADLKELSDKVQSCEYCKNLKDGICTYYATHPKEKANCGDGNFFEWRGVQEV